MRHNPYIGMTEWNYKNGTRVMAADPAAGKDESAWAMVEVIGGSPQMFKGQSLGDLIASTERFLRSFSLRQISWPRKTRKQRLRQKELIKRRLRKTNPDQRRWQSTIQALWE